MKKPNTTFRDIPPCIVCWSLFVVARIGYWFVGLFAKKVEPKSAVPVEEQPPSLRN